MGLRHAPMAFTEQGIAMLSSVLNTERAIQVNIAIMRACVQLRRRLASHANLARELAERERKYDHHSRVLFDAIDQLMAAPERPRRSIDFRVEECGHPARPLAPVLGVSPQAVYQAMARGRVERAIWERLLRADP